MGSSASSLTKEVRTQREGFAARLSAPGIARSKHFDIPDTRPTSLQSQPAAPLAADISLSALQETTIASRLLHWRSKIYDPALLPSDDGGYDQIRLLTLLPGSRGSRICCEMHIYHLDTSPAFEALSYVWGRPEFSRLIWVNGKVLPITANLEGALEHLRLPDRPRFLWVDAICINQSDLTERSNQVLLMRRTYQTAEGVLIWLGESDSDSVRAFSLLERIYRDERALPIILSRARLEKRDPPNFSREQLLPDDLTALKNTFSGRPWWKRMWIIQEAVFARKAHFICGNLSMSWDLLEQLLDSFKDDEGPKLFDTEAVLANTMYVAILITVLRRCFHDRDYQSPYKLSLESLVVLFESSVCTDPRDRIYALIGLTHGSILEIRPDYNLSPTAVFREATLSMICQANSLDVLAYAYRSEASSAAGHPSWVPDWSIERLFSSLIYSPMQSNRPIYSCGGPSIYTYQNTDLSELPVEAFCYDTIYAILRKVDTTEADWKEWFRNWHPGYDHNSPTFRTYWRTLMQDVERMSAWPTRIPDSYFEFYDSKFQEWSSCPTFDLHQLSSPTLAAFRHGYSAAPTRDHISSFSDCLGSHLHGWTLCQTTRGHLSWVPNTALEGDSVFVAKGSSLPLVLRDRGNESGGERGDREYWTLIGTAYVHGIMDGEAIDKGERLRDYTGGGWKRSRYDIIYLV